MTLPPFPFLPASPEERLRLTQYGELVRAMAMETAMNLCEGIENRHYERMRQRDSHSVQYIEGKSDGAGECARAIRVAMIDAKGEK